MKVYIVYDWCGLPNVARTYKGAVQFMLQRGMILDDDEIELCEKDSTPKTIQEYLGENWRDIITNKWTIKDFQKYYWGYNSDIGIYEVNLIEKTS